MSTSNSVLISNIVLYFEYQSNFIESPLDDVRGDVYNKVSFSGITTGTTLSAQTADLETVSVSFITSGAITNAA